METHVKKWGNSLGIRLPKILTKALKITEGSIIEIEEENGKIILTPASDDLSIQFLTHGMTVEGVRDQFNDYLVLGEEEII